MLFASVSDFKSLRSVPLGVDGIELRLDLFSHLEEKIISPLPLLFTLRRNDTRSEEERESLIRHFFFLKPSFFDLEHDMRPEFLQWAFQQDVKIILSYHNFEETPSDLDSIYQSMRMYPAYTYKMATMTKSVNDALRLLLFAKNHSDVSAICMGEKGTFGRILGPVVGNLIDYCYVEKSTAPGQLCLQELIHTYNYHNLTPKTALFGLIGNPVEQSQGHIFHNLEFQKNQLNAVYVKMIVEEGDLTEFFKLAGQIGFRGLSVTMPLKEKVIPHLGPVNTVLLGETLNGFSFDGPAALDAIGDVMNKKIVLIGDGGASRAIALASKKRGAYVTILSRKACNLNQVPSHDILINCTPSPMPIAPEAIIAGTVVMDLVYSPPETPFLKAAALRGAQTISGYEMFKNQAKAQFELWRQLA